MIYNRLSGAQNERLALLAEELSEAIQIVCKIQRHGYHSINPLLPAYKQETNQLMLEKELGHVMLAYRLMITENDINELNVKTAQKEKSESIDKWLHYNSTKAKEA